MVNDPGTNCGIGSGFEKKALKTLESERETVFGFGKMSIDNRKFSFQSCLEKKRGRRKIRKIWPSNKLKTCMPARLAEPGRKDLELLTIS